MRSSEEIDAPTRYADSDGVSIAYQVHGEGELDLVLVPGFVSHVELLWEEPSVARFLRRLATFARLILFDKRGQGLSDRPVAPPTLEDSMGDLRAVLEAADCETAAIFGVSEGGPMSALFAATYPERVSSLVLYGTFARMVKAPDFSLGLPAEARSILPSIGVPTLVLHRADDRVVLPGQGRYLAEEIPGARYVEVEGVDHLAWVGDQAVLLDEVEEFLVGSRRAHEPERALATVLFTDIVGSTERAAELGDKRWRDLLERHDALVRRQLGIHRGREVKTMGDGFLATFDGPARAIRCAQAIDEAVGDVGLEMRAGIHTGEVELIGDDVSGMAVNIGARIGALAEPGEVLVSSTVRELVVGSGLEFADRGAHSLKGAPGEWRLFAVL